MKTTVSTEYIAPKVRFASNLRNIICAGSGNASYEIEFEEITLGDELSFD